MKTSITIYKFNNNGQIGIEAKADEAERVVFLLPKAVLSFMEYQGEDDWDFNKGGVVEACEQLFDNMATSPWSGHWFANVEVGGLLNYSVTTEEK